MPDPRRMKNQNLPGKTETPNRGCLQRLVIRPGNRLPVPVEVARCPECNGQLTWQVTTTDGLEDLYLDCENETQEEFVDRTDEHRWWQGEWEPVINKVKRWIRRSYNARTERPEAK